MHLCEIHPKLEWPCAELCGDMCSLNNSDECLRRKKMTDKEELEPTFAETFRKVINRVDPVANSAMTQENTPIKLIADWGRKACDELELSPWILITPESLPKEQKAYWVTDGHTTGVEMFLLKPMKPSFGNEPAKPSFSDWATHYQPITLPKEKEDD